MKLKSNILHIIAALALFCSAALSASAQTSIRGTVKDSEGEPVIGAVVMLEGNSTIACVTDVKGEWSLILPSGVKSPVLAVSCLGYLEQKVEAVLTGYELFFHKSETWIEEEKMYEVLYELTV